MTQEEKQLLLKDLYARLSYDPFIKIGENSNVFKLSQRVRWICSYGEVENMFDGVKPYLRPMTSMTEEEIDEIKSLLPFHSGDMFVNDDEIKVFETNGEFSLSHHLFEEMISFYNSHHLDYRGLIPMGLALEAPEGMYNTK